MFGDRCFECNRKVKRLEFAHIKPTGLNGRSRGFERRYLDVLRHPDCYMPACKKCHILIDEPLEGQVERFGSEAVVSAPDETSGAPF